MSADPHPRRRGRLHRLRPVARCSSACRSSVAAGRVRVPARPQRRRQDARPCAASWASRRRRAAASCGRAATSARPRALPGRAGRHRLRARGPPHLRRSDGVGEPRRREPRARPAAASPSSACTTSSRSCASCGTARAASSPAASSRCSRSPARLMGNPELLLLDEPSEGLAPLVVDHLQRADRPAQADGLTILLAEQNVEFCLALADRVYVLEKGHIRYEGTRAATSARTSRSASSTWRCSRTRSPRQGDGHAAGLVPRRGEDLPIAAGRRLRRGGALQRRHRGRRVLLPARPERLRQDDRAQDARGLRGADGRPHPAWTARPVGGPSRDRAVVFQGDDSLYGWLTAVENVEFGLRMRACRRRSGASAPCAISTWSGSRARRGSTRRSSRAA